MELNFAAAMRVVCSSVLLCLDVCGADSHLSSVVVSLWPWGIGLQGTLHSASVTLKVGWGLLWLHWDQKES